MTQTPLDGLPRIHIMIVEDHDPTCEGLRALLDTNAQFSVVAEASSGEEALEKIALQTVDVVLMDINLPGMDGIQATTEPHRLQPGCQVRV